MLATPAATDSWPADPSPPSNSSIRAHPRLIAPGYKWTALTSGGLIANDPYLNYWNKTIVQNASSTLSDDPEAYVIDGGLSGSGVLDVARRIKLKVKNWSYAYRITNETKYADRVFRELQVSIIAEHIAECIVCSFLPCIADPRRLLQGIILLFRSVPMTELDGIRNISSMSPSSATPSQLHTTGFTISGPRTKSSRSCIPFSISVSPSATTHFRSNLPRQAILGGPVLLTRLTGTGTVFVTAVSLWPLSLSSTTTRLVSLQRCSPSPFQALQTIASRVPTPTVHGQRQQTTGTSERPEQARWCRLSSRLTAMTEVSRSRTPAGSSHRSSTCIRRG